MVSQLAREEYSGCCYIMPGSLKSLGNIHCLGRTDDIKLSGEQKNVVNQVLQVLQNPLRPQVTPLRPFCIHATGTPITRSDPPNRAKDP